MCVCVCVCVCTKHTHTRECICIHPHNHTWGARLVGFLGEFGLPLASHVSSSSYDMYPPPHTWGARLVGFLGEFGAEHTAEETLLDLRERVVVGSNHVLVVAREGYLLRLEVVVILRECAFRV